MRRTIGKLCALGALSLVTLCAAVCAAADKSELAFDPPLSVSIRQTNGLTARGKLLTVTEQELVLRAVNGKEVKFKLDRIRFVKNTDETFEYWPNKEKFSELCKRVDEVPDATLNNAAHLARRDGRPQRSPQPDPADVRGESTRRTRPAIASSENDLRAPGGVDESPGAGGPRVQNAADAQQQPARRNFSADDTPLTTDDVADPPARGSVIYSCSNCTQDLPATIRSGDSCPHCGEIAVFEEDSAELAATVDPRGDPFAAAGPPTVPVSVAHVAAPQPTGGLSIAEMPFIAKIGIFAGFLFLGWILLQRR